MAAGTSEGSGSPFVLVRGGVGYEWKGFFRDSVSFHVTCSEFETLM
jgi:hypothetical protein